VFVPHGQRRIGFEIKRTTTPKVTPSIGAAMDALNLQEVAVIHAGDQSFPLGKKVRAVEHPG
jgi:hypothetical protein